VDWKKVREDFPVTRDRIYFMSAGLSPIPTPVLARIVDEYTKLNAAGDVHWERDLSSYRALCARIARHIGAGAGDIAVVQNTSTAMSLLALSLKMGMRGSFNVVSMMDEFPSTTIPFEYQGIGMKYVEPDGCRYPIEKILAAVDSNTAAVLTSYVQYATGFRQDLATLGAELKRRGVLFLVNATQAFPLFPIDAQTMHIDAISASLHKWGFVGHAGAMFFTSPEFRARFKAPMAGWLSVDPHGKDFIHTGKNEPFNLYASADRYVMGCINFQAINPMASAFDYLEAIGFEAIRARLFELTDTLIAGLRSTGIDVISPVETSSERSAIVSFTLGEATKGCLKELLARRIYVSFRGGNIRVSVNIFNDASEIDALLEVVGRFKNGMRDERLGISF
jgi:selenocysteine lyase/cysteine desulfurase